MKTADNGCLLVRPRQQLLVKAVSDIVDYDLLHKYFPGGFVNNAAFNAVYGTGWPTDKASSAYVHDLIKEEIITQIVPLAKANLFMGVTQALQVFYDNPDLIQEVRDEGRRIHVPFDTQESGVHILTAFRESGTPRIESDAFPVPPFYKRLEMYEAPCKHVFVLPVRELARL